MDISLFEALYRVLEVDSTGHVGRWPGGKSKLIASGDTLVITCCEREQAVYTDGLVAGYALLNHCEISTAWDPVGLDFTINTVMHCGA